MHANGGVRTMNFDRSYVCLGNTIFCETSRIHFQRLHDYVDTGKTLMHVTGRAPPCNVDRSNECLTSKISCKTPRNQSGLRYTSLAQRATRRLTHFHILQNSVDTGRVSCTSQAVYLLAMLSSHTHILLAESHARRHAPACTDCKRTLTPVEVP